MCTSVNECICHGIPDSRQLKDGDIVNIDVTVYLNVSSVETSVPRDFVIVIACYCGVCYLYLMTASDSSMNGHAWHEWEAGSVAVLLPYAVINSINHAGSLPSQLEILFAGPDQSMLTINLVL